MKIRFQHLFPAVIFILSYTITWSQGVGIGTTTPDSTAILDLSSTTKGALMPRMTTVQRDAIVSPAPGLMIINLDDLCVDIWNGMSWIKNCGVKMDTAAVAGFWSAGKDFGPGVRTFAVGLSIGQKGYVGLGRIGSASFSDFWEYDLVSRVWTQKADFEPGTRYQAVGFSIGQKGYVGTGNVGITPQNDFWEYDPALNDWVQKASLPGLARSRAVGFSIGNKGYIGTGIDPGTNKLADFWEYDPGQNSWVQKASLPGAARGRAVGIRIGNKGYIGTGADPGNVALADFWEYDPAPNTWTQKADIPGGARLGAFAFSMGNKGYVGAGVEAGVNKSDFWEFNPSSNSWIQRTDYPGGVRNGAVSFSIGNIGFAGTGQAGGEWRDFWEYHPYPVSVDQYTESPAVYQSIDPLWTKRMDTLYTTNPVYRLGLGLSRPGAKLHVHQEPGSPTAPAGDLILSRIWNSTTDTRASSIFHYYDTGSSKDKLAFGVSGAGGTNGAPNDIAQTKMVIEAGGNIGVGTSTPNESAILDLSSTTKGMLMPRMTTAQRDAIVSPSPGLMIINLDDLCVDIWNGMSWIKNCGVKIDTAAAATLGFWSRSIDFGGGVRANGVGFSIGQKGYVGTGKNPSITSDFWEYDPMTRVWTQKASMPDARYGAVGFSIGQKGYVGLGNNSSEITINDFWEYDPALNAWVEKASLPAPGRFKAVGFCIGSKGYVGTGRDPGGIFYTNDFWEYDPVLDAWGQKASFSGGLRGRAIGMSIGNKGYVGTGLNQDGLPKDDFWEYDAALDTWAQKADMPGGSRSNAFAFSIGDKGYAGAGVGKSDFWEYNPASDSWSQRPDFGGGSRNTIVAFSIGNIGYAGTGQNASLYFADFWEYHPHPVSVDQYSESPSVYLSIDPLWTKRADTLCTTSPGSRLGLGLSKPGAKLHIQKDQNVPNAPAGDLILSRLWNSPTDTRASAIYHFYDAMNNDYMAFGVSGGGGPSMDAPNAIAQTKMVIQASGNVGIGNTAPSQKLHVTGKIRMEDASMGAGKVLTSDANGVGTWTTESDPKVISATPNKVPKWNGTALTDGLLFDDGANIGIGNTSPSQKLHVTGKIRMEDASMGAGKVLTSDANGVGTWTTESDPKVISATANKVPKWNGTALADGLLFDDGTNIGIGNTAPSQKLHVTGKIRMEDASMGAGKVLTSDANGVGTWTTESDPQVISATTNKVPKWNGTALTDGLIIDDGNKIGFNITTPNSRLHIHDPSGAQNAPSSDLILSRVWNSNTDTRASALFHLYLNTTGKDYLAFGVSGEGGTNGAPNATSQIKMVIQADGNVGVGSLVPNANLHIHQDQPISNTPGADLILSKEWTTNTFTRASSIFNYYDSGTSNDNLAFGVSGNGGSFAAPNALSQTKMLIQASGNVGIGTLAPTQKLHVNGKIRMEDASMGAGKVLTSDANGVGTWTTESDPQVTSATTNKIPKWNGTTLTDGLILDDGNKVGFNITTPNSRLHIHDPSGAQNAPSADLVLSRVWNSNTDTRASAVFHYYSTTSTKDNLAFGVSGGGGTNGAPNAVAQIKMIIQADGFVGIGNTNPQAPLHVGVGSGITSPNQNRAFFNSSTGPNIIQDMSSSGNIQIRADGYYWANGGGYVATSDSRIKNIRHTSNSEKDLSILNQIKITDYTYIDSITNGNTPQKKVIAQQLQSVYPQAVNTNKGIIPNVFEVAQSSEVKDSVTIITTNKPHTFAEGDEVKLILEGKGEQTCHVHVIDAHTFTTDQIINEKIFVYGKKVDDLLNVDYDAVSMLNVSATQALSKQVEMLKAENAKQQVENSALKTEIDTLKAEVEQKLKALEAKLEKQM